MIGLLQRVVEAEVRVNEQSIARIGPGLVVLIGVEREDTDVHARRLAGRLVKFRVFPDAQEKMNLDIKQTGGELLLVPQFTLVADTARGNRPSFTRAAAPAKGRQLYEILCAECARLGVAPRQGAFGAHMQVQLVNDGPVTFQLRVPA